MTTQRKFAFLFVAVPLILPFFVTLAYSSFKFMKLNIKPLSIQNEYSLDQIAKATIQVLKVEEAPLPDVAPEEWLFDVKPTKREERPVVIATAPVLSPEPSLSALSEKIVKEEDPFLNDWREKQQGGTVVLNTQKSIQVKHSNLNLTDNGNRYLNYADVQGTLEWPNLDRAQFFAEVSFYDQMGQNGLNDDLSTVLASQELRDDSPFLLKLPAETSGYLMAKVYSVSDTQKENPLYVGTYPQNPLFVPKEGLGRLLISVVPTAEYVDRTQTIFLGKVVNEYLAGSLEAEEGISGVRIWVVETQEHGESNEKGFFEIKGLLKHSVYHLIFEKEGFATIQIPIQIIQKKNHRVFALPPMTKFTQGYDLLLGERDPSRSVLFATLLKEGIPLSRAVVMVTSIEKVFYERHLGFISVPDSTLFSTTENGKFLLWNIYPGKHKLHIYQDGQLISTQVVTLSPGVMHYLTLEL